MLLCFDLMLLFTPTIKNFNIQVDPLNERNTVTSGDLVTGHISFELTKETKVTSITMAMKGKAMVHWSRSAGKGKRRHYSAKLDFFKLKNVILQETSSSISGVGPKLQPGTHMYPFSCQLPQGDFPPSYMGPSAHITYTLTVGINRPWHLSKDTDAQLNFVNRIDTTQPELWAPLTGSNRTTLCCLCCASGPIGLTARTEKKAFTPGETVKIICDFSNTSSRILTPKVTLQQKQVCYTLSKHSHMMLIKKLVNLTGNPVSAFTSNVQNDIMLTIPPSTPLSISNCSILEVDYFVEVSLCARFSHDLTVLIPIILYDPSAVTQPPPYSHMTEHTSQHIESSSVLSGTYLVDTQFVMSSDTKISVGYKPINKSNIFTSGDYITGEITLELAKECKIESLSVKLKGKAEVQWREHYGKTIVTFHKKVKYFSIKQDVIQVNQGNNTVGQGSHVYPFTFQIPAQGLPSSFKGSHGKIQYNLEANLSRSMRMDSKAKAEFTLICSGNPNGDALVMAPQQQATDKKMKLFTSGTVGMDVNIARTGYHQGEGIQVVASIQNRSSREIKPKYCLYKKYSYFAKGKRKVETKDILKEVGEPIPPSAGQTVTRTITIPYDTCVSILNCQIIKAEYRLRVYLDVKYASDPQIKFPIIILPALPGSDEEQKPAYLAYGFGAFANSDMHRGTDFPNNPSTTGPSAPPPSYGAHHMYPTLANLDEKSYSAFNS
ncbi:uncharacterized protein LOC117818610 [Notolabrus celidotus]|uniref:uncharacterized protein LOC117818610 n=1 Tax=Notolabrus celidotus TaxID=1203425 RepID=UPI00148F92A5|nr:uncharacterized protein LOC117818610 [Notolabrus celidotus]